MDECHESLARRNREGIETLRGPEHPRCAPVSRETSAVSGQEHGVDGAGCGAQILLVLDRILGAESGRDDERRGAIELGCRFGARCLLQPGKRARAQNPESPRVRQVMIRRPACHLEQLVQQLGWDRLCDERLVRAPGANCLLDIHRVNGSGALQRDRVADVSASVTVSANLLTDETGSVGALPN